MGATIIAGSHPSPVFNPYTEILDLVPLAVKFIAMMVLDLAVISRRIARSGALFDQRSMKPVATIAFISEQSFAQGGADKRRRTLIVTRLAFGEQQHGQPAQSGAPSNGSINNDPLGP